MSFTDSVGGEVANSYSLPKWSEAGQGLFTDVLSGWLTYEQIKAQSDATQAGQAATRNQPTTTSAQPPTDYADTGSASVSSGGGMTDGQKLLIGGAVILGVVLMVKGG